MKYRKPRFRPKRIAAAEQFLETAQKFIKDGLALENPTHNDIARNTEHKKNRKPLSVGREFISDLILWQRSQLHKEK